MRKKSNVPTPTPKQEREGNVPAHIPRLTHSDRTAKRLSKLSQAELFELAAKVPSDPRKRERKHWDIIEALPDANVKNNKPHPKPAEILKRGELY